MEAAYVLTDETGAEFRADEVSELTGRRVSIRVTPEDDWDDMILGAAPRTHIKQTESFTMRLVRDAGDFTLIEDKHILAGERVQWMRRAVDRLKAGEFNSYLL